MMVEKESVKEGVERNAKEDPFLAAKRLAEQQLPKRENVKKIKEIVEECIEQGDLESASDIVYAFLDRNTGKISLLKRINDGYIMREIIKDLKEGLKDERAIDSAEYLVDSLSKGKNKMQKLIEITEEIKASIDRKSYDYALSKAEEIPDKELRIEALKEIVKGYIKNNKLDSALDIVKNSLPKDEEGEQAIGEIAEELLKRGNSEYASKIINEFISNEDKKAQLFEKITEYEEKKEELGNKLRG
jgi:predicted Zn-dependent protease